MNYSMNHSSDDAGIPTLTEIIDDEGVFEIESSKATMQAKPPIVAGRLELDESPSPLRGEGLGRGAIGGTHPNDSTLSPIPSPTSGRGELHASALPIIETLEAKAIATWSDKDWNHLERTIRERILDCLEEPISRAIAQEITKLRSIKK